MMRRMIPKAMKKVTCPLFFLGYIIARFSLRCDPHSSSQSGRGIYIKLPDKPFKYPFCAKFVFSFIKFAQKKHPQKHLLTTPSSPSPNRNKHGDHQHKQQKQRYNKETIGCCHMAFHKRIQKIRLFLIDIPATESLHTN